MTFNLTDVDQTIISEISFVLEDVNDVGKHPNNTIKFQFPPVIKSDSKEGRWQNVMDAPGYEPEYMYIGAQPRKLQVSTTYVIGGPTGGSSNGRGWGIPEVVDQVRTWKKYFYFANFAANGGGGGGTTTASGGGIGEGKNLPIYRIVWGEFLPDVYNKSSWRAMNYNIKHSSTFIRDGNQQHPLITEVTVNLELATQVRITENDPPKQDHPNLLQFAPPEWY